MSDLPLSHRETETAIPDPLDHGGWINRLMTRSLPAVMLTWTSILAFAAVFGVLQADPVLRIWFPINIRPDLESSRYIVVGVVTPAAFLAWRKPRV